MSSGEIAALAASTAIGVAALIVAFVALVSDRSFRSREALAHLLERFESGGFQVAMWRLEQATRGDHDAWSLHRVEIDELRRTVADHRAKRRLVDDAIARDWGSERALMHELYFFALRVHAWLVATWSYRRRRARLLNDTFGYQLLSTLLDHRIFALRLQKPGEKDSYYPTQYGCLDPACLDLVRRLAKELLDRGENTTPPAEIRERLRRKRRATDARLHELGGPGAGSSWSFWR